MPGHVRGQDERGHVTADALGHCGILHPAEDVRLRAGEDLQGALAVVPLQGGVRVPGPELCASVLVVTARWGINWSGELFLLKKLLLFHTLADLTVRPNETFGI